MITSIGRSFIWFFVVCSSFIAKGNCGESVNFDLNNFHVCTVSNRENGLKNLLNSCKKNSIPIEVLGMNKPYPNNTIKLTYVLEYLKDFPDDHIVLFVDAFDVIILDNKPTILKKFLDMKVPFVIAAEKTCFPYPNLASKFPTSTTPFRFINTGTYIGYVGYVKKLLSEVTKISPDFKDDQAQMSLHYVDHQDLYVLDYQCNLFFPLEAVESSEYIIDRDNFSVFCKATGTTPSIIHGNGNGKDRWNAIAQALKLHKSKKNK